MKSTKRLAAPRSWKILRKTNKFVSSISSGPHPKERALPLVVLLRDILNLVDSAKEAKRILHLGEILIDAKVRKDPRFPVGLFDVVTIPKTGASYRMILDTKGYLVPIKINKKDSGTKPCKIVKKSAIKGNQIQLNLHDGRNITIPKSKDVYNTKDSIIISLPEQKIVEHMKCDKNVSVYMIDGNHVGEIAVLKKFHSFEGPQVNRVVLKNEEGAEYETIENYIFVLGDKTSLIGAGK